MAKETTAAATAAEKSELVFFESHKGTVAVDEMSEEHLRNVLKKLIKDGVAPKGEVLVDKVDQKQAAKAFNALNTFKKAVAAMGTGATEEGAESWSDVCDQATELQTALRQYIDSE